LPSNARSERMNELSGLCVSSTAMAFFRVITPGVTDEIIRLNPGCNRVGSKEDVEIILRHPSVSHPHCELWLTDDAVLVRDLDSQNGTFVEGERVGEAQILENQTVRLGEVELLLLEAPARVSVPEIPLPVQPKPQLYMEDGTPSCFHHDTIAAAFQCVGKCGHAFCGRCVRELRVTGGTPRRFCPDCGGPCERVVPSVREEKRASWLDKIKKAFTEPPRR
jgi:hypothetical protein